MSKHFPRVQRATRPLLVWGLLGLLALATSASCSTEKGPAVGAGAEAGQGGEGSPAAGMAGQATNEAGAGGEGGGAGEGGAPVQVAVPSPIEHGDVQVTCSVTCEDGSNCANGSVFVSACAGDQPGLCYSVTPIDDADGEGNTYLISVSEDGDADVIENVSCEAGQDSKEGLPVDLLFVIDTTSSMSEEIAGVKASINTLVNQLAVKGLKLQIGGIAFGDKAPLSGCVAPDAPFRTFTELYGADSVSNPDSFNFWLNNVAVSHCGDYGGTTLQEGGLDALAFALGTETDPNDAFDPSSFVWRPNALHEIVIVTDAPQSQLKDKNGLVHVDLVDVAAQVTGFAVVHVVGPNYGCYNTPAAACACNVTRNACDEGCDCDLRCRVASCAADTQVGSCNDATATCDPDCLGYPKGSKCDVTQGRCDPSTEDPTQVCADDADCRSTTSPGPAGVARRCEPSPTGFADVGELTLATHGTFTTLPANGAVDLAKLPLTGVLSSTEHCAVPLPEGAVSLRCVYIDAEGHQGEASVDIK
ncbi:MAG: hypothetical protein WDO74_37990 [Pseudomonadota bacterium]